MSGEKPQVVIIAGPNGAGKSTLAPVLLRDTFGLLEFVNADTISAVYDNSGSRSPLLVATGEQQRKLKVIRPDLWQTLVEGRS